MNKDYSQISHSVEPKGWDKDELVQKVSLYAWNPSTLQWERYTQTGNATTNPNYVQPVSSSTPAVTQVADNASSVNLSVSNASWLGRGIYNASTSALYVKFGTTASATSFTTKLFADDFFEVPFQYTGRIDGIWDSAAGGFGYVTELLA